MEPKEHNAQHGWVRFADRFPDKLDCDIYGKVECWGSGERWFEKPYILAEGAYNLKRTAWWRTPAPLPFVE